MWRAPAWRTTAVAISPIGPAPEISTSSPRIGNASAVWTALPNGSKIAAISSSMPDQWCQMLVIGRATNSAKDPSRPTPRPMVLAHRCRRPARQWRQRPHTTWPSPLTRSPAWKSTTLLPTSTISPTNSWPTISGGWMVFAAHGSHDSMCRSVPQIPVLWTRIRTSLIPIVGSGTSRRTSPGPASGLTRASTGGRSARAGGAAALALGLALGLAARARRRAAGRARRRAARSTPGSGSGSGGRSRAARAPG